MKILLLGEFSGFHRNLQIGLMGLGHEVDLLARRDGFKKLDVDVDLDFQGRGLRSALRTLSNRLSIGKVAQEYDVVQLVNSVLFMDTPILNELIMFDLLRRGGNVFLSACGTDPAYMAHARQRMRYTPIDDWLNLDKKTSRHPLEWSYYRGWHDYVCKKVKGVIPIAYDYSVCYQDYPNVSPVIPLPINLEAYAPSPKPVSDKVVVLHGLIRPGFKGTAHILDAFKILETEFPGRFEFIAKGSLPLAEYISLMERADIVVDQANSYSYGMNAVQALALGKVVLSGMEPESLLAMGLQDSPVVNILPDARQIADAIAGFLEPAAIRERGAWSRRYAEEVHDCRTIARQYLTTWNAN